MEKWKKIEKHPHFEVSDMGNVRSLRTGRIVKQRVHKGAYRCCTLDNKAAVVHRLVGEAFLGPKPEGWDTRHLNGKGHDNRAKNLSYGERWENFRDMKRHHPEYNFAGKLDPEDVRFVWESFFRDVPWQETAKRLSVDRRSVEKITTGKTWAKHSLETWDNMFALAQDHPWFAFQATYSDSYCPV